MYGVEQSHGPRFEHMRKTAPSLCYCASSVMSNVLTSGLTYGQTRFLAELVERSPFATKES